MRIYLDHNATTPLAPGARRAVSEALDVAGNPSSIHEEGRAARDLVERSRRRVAELLGAAGDEIVFTSGGTEADWLAVIGLARLGRRRGQPPVVVAPSIEHPAVHGAIAALARDGFEVAQVPVDRSGVVDADALAARCRDGVACVCVSLANHELGTVQDVGALAGIARDGGALVHCDAVQAIGKIPVDVTELDVDTLAVSGHKLYGPKGVGALWIRPELDFEPPHPGGHQERGRRPGTENVPGIAGLGAAARLAVTETADAGERMARLGRRLEEGVAAIEGARVHGAGAPRVPGTVNVGFDGALGEVVVAGLDLEGIAASTGAACTSGTVEPSPVLRGAGLDQARAAEAVRFSLGRGTTAEDIDVVLDRLPDIVDRARRFR